MLPLLESLALVPFFIGLGEGALGELMLMVMVVVDGAGTDVWEIPRPDARGEEAASGFLEGEPVFSVEPTVFTGLSLDLQSDGAVSFSLLLNDTVLAGLEVLFKVLSLIQDGAAAAGAVGSTLVSSALRRTLPEGPLAPDSTGETLLLFAFSPA